MSMYLIEYNPDPEDDMADYLSFTTEAPSAREAAILWRDWAAEKKDTTNMRTMDVYTWRRQPRDEGSLIDRGRWEPDFDWRLFGPIHVRDL